MSKNKDLQGLLGSRIAKLRKIKGFSQEKFAEAVGIAQRTLSCIETGVNFTQANTLEKMAEVLEISTETLFNFNEEYTQKELLKSINSKISFIKNDEDKLRILNEFLNKMF